MKIMRESGLSGFLTGLYFVTYAIGLAGLGRKFAQRILKDHLNILALWESA